jgi:hypothetical protein
LWNYFNAARDLHPAITAMHIAAPESSFLAKK